MRSTLVLIPLEVGDVPLFGWGVLLAIWAVASALLLAWLLRRHGWSRKTVDFLPAMLVLGAVIWIAPRFFESMGGIPIRGYGLMVLLGASAGIALDAARAQRMGMNPDHIVSACFWMIVAGIIGARAFYVLQYWPDFRAPSVGETVKNTLNYTRGGLVIYGSILGGAVAFFYYVRRHRIPVMAFADLIVPGLAVGIAMGRLGCFLNGCCYGGVCDAPWAVTFPADSAPYTHQAGAGQLHGFLLRPDPQGRPVVESVVPESVAGKAGLERGDVVASIGGNPTQTLVAAQQNLIDAARAGLALQIRTTSGAVRELDALANVSRSLPTHPAQIYSALTAALIAWVLWAAYPFRRSDGQMLALFMILYPAGRFLLEMIRTDEAAVGGTGLTISQNLSVVFFLAGIGGMVFLRCRPARLALPPALGGDRDQHRPSAAD